MQQSRILNLIIAVLVLSLSSCGLSVPEDPDPGPHQTLLTIARMTRDNNYSELDKYIFSVEVGTNVTSGEWIRDGIINKESAGDFSYSPEKFILAATKFKHLFQPATTEVLEKYFFKDDALFKKYENLQQIARNEPQRIWEFRRGDSTMLFLEDEGRYKILFTTFMTNLR